MSHHNLERALNCDKSIFIQACAGAGKTFALTKRYAAILDQFAQEAASGTPIEEIDHKKILVITFTKKATGEMNERIYKDVNILLSGKELPKMTEQGIDFCPTLRTNHETAVQDYTKRLKDTFSQNSISTIDSFCAGILREFAHRIDLDPQFVNQDDAQARQLFEMHLERWLKSTAVTFPDDLSRLFVDMRVNNIRTALTNIYRHREVLEDYFLDIENQTDAKIWKQWLLRYTPDADIETLAISFESLWKNAQTLCNDQEDALYKLLQGMSEKLKLIHSYNDPLEFRAAFLSELVRSSSLITQKGTYTGRFPGAQSNWTDKKKQAIDWFELLQRIDIQDLLATPGPEDKNIIPLLRSLVLMYRDFDTYYLDVRKKQNVLDFSDIILYTHQLLEKFPDICKQIAGRYRHIMVDEFQDTNPLRWNIIKSIFQAADSRNPIQLFIVGDRKQSIYRFNNADVTVMNAAETLIRELDGEVLDFNDNYRSTPGFVDKGINAIFGISDIIRQKNEAREDYEAYFEPTISKKSNLTTYIKPAIETHWCNSSGSNSDMYLPAHHTATCVKEILRELKNGGIDSGTDEPLVGVLLRRSSHIEDYLQAFRMLDIPVSIIGGRGFYQTGVSRDVHHFLSVLDNPYDDHAMLGLLRSPFIALSDPEIHLLAKRDKNSSLFAVMVNYPELQKTREIILSWIDKSRSTPLDELLIEIMDSDDRELGYVSELMPRQRLANMDKAINIIRGMVRSGKNLRSIREHFSYFINKKITDESQALYPEQARIHILTVHKAKGLEYPVIVLPELNQSGRSNTDILRYGHTQGYRDMSLSLTGKEKPGLLRNLKVAADKEEAAEETRVFYVAVTRAIHKVYFLGEEARKSTKNTWWKRFVLPLYGIDPKEKVENWPREFIYQHEAENIFPKEQKAKIKNAEWTDKVSYPMARSYHYCSPHDLMRNNMPIIKKENSRGGGMVVGTCYHLCLEKGWLDIAAQKEILTSIIRSDYPDAQPEKILAECQLLLNKTRKHPLYSIISNPMIEKYNELPLTGWLQNKQETLQVNGKIDLLYCEKGEWVIVDFKTDAGKERLESYQKQIQTYQWMVKQAYGINAIGKLYFVRLDECIEVPRDVNYFNSLPIGTDYQPVLPQAQLDVETLLPKLKGKYQLLFCANNHHAGQIFLALTCRGLMKPSITLTTFSKWIQRSSQRSISDDKLRLMVMRESEFSSRGHGHLLAQAIRDAELQKGNVLDEFSPLQKRIHDLCTSSGYVSSAVAYSDTCLWDFAADTQVGFIDLPPLTPLQENVKLTIEKNAQHFSCSLIPETEGDTEAQYIQAFSPREEVFAVADHIISSKSAKEDILIAVSSMEKYAPHIKRIFPALGLPIRFTDTRSLMEAPVTQLLLDLLRLSSLNRYAWTDLAPLLLHPLCRPNAKLWEYDRKVRQHPEWNSSLPQLVSDFIEKFLKINVRNLSAKCAAFIETLDVQHAGVENAVIAKFSEILNDVIHDMKDMGIQISVAEVYQECKTRVQKASTSRRFQSDGIQIVGLLDSLGLTPKRMIIMGMVEGDVPRREQSNPYFAPNEHYSLNLNRHFMRYWQSLGKRIVFSTCTHSEDGKEQQVSSFLEGYIATECDCRHIFNRRETLLAYADCTLNADFPLAQRHNEILCREPGIYSGQVGKARKHLQISVSAVDKLLACPMRYYYEYVLHIQTIDEDEQDYWVKTVGSIIHSILEYFGKQGGFDLSQSSAVLLLQKNIDKIFTEKQLNMADPFICDRFRYYILNLEESSDQNCLVQLLEWNAEKFADYKANAFEYRFGMGQETGLKRKFGDIEVEIRGIIDKIMINEDKKEVIASDYKTGSINRPAFRKYLSAQLYLYTLKCMKLYPGYTASATYEQIKNPEKGHNGVRRFSEANDHFTETTTKSDTSINITIFNKLLSKLFNDISDGRYYITDRPYRDVCEYCPHEGLCRKASRLKTTRNNGTAEIIHTQGGKDE